MTKRKIVLITVFTTFGFSFTGLCDEDAESIRLKNLRESYEREIDRVTSPVDQKYLDALKALKKDYTTAGNLEDANAVVAEIKRMEGLDSASQERLLADFLVSTKFVLKWGASKTKQISFLADGSIGIGRNDWENAWAIKDGELHIIKKEGRPSWVFSYDPMTKKFAHSETPHELADHKASLRVTNG